MCEGLRVCVRVKGVFLGGVFLGFKGVLSGFKGVLSGFKGVFLGFKGVREGLRVCS